MKQSKIINKNRIKRVKEKDIETIREINRYTAADFKMRPYLCH